MKMNLVCNSRRIIKKSTHVCLLRISGENKSTADEITTILKHKNWKFLLDSSRITQKLNPDVVQSVIDENKLLINPKRLLDFFDWPNHKLGVDQNIDSFSILALVLCNSNNFAPANNMFDKMLQRRFLVTDVFGSLVKCFKECERFRLTNVSFELLIDVSGKKVYEGMVEGKMNVDVYTHTNVINAYCKVGNVKEATRLLHDMGEKGCSPNLVTYNVVIKGLCGAGRVDEAMELKKSMEGKGLVPDMYTYSAVIDGFCKKKRSREAKLIFDKMCEVGLSPDQFVYTVLMEGFMKEGEVDEAFRIKDEIAARGKSLNLVTNNSFIRGLCKVDQMDKAVTLKAEMIEMGVLPTIT